MHDASAQRERHERVTEVIRTFYQSKLTFDEIRSGYEETGAVDFEKINTFVKGCVFGLKEDAHFLFRGTEPSKIGGIRAEDLFDVLVGSIFHELMKLKECAYQIQQYGPTYERMQAVVNEMDAPEYERDFLDACSKIIHRAREAVKEGIPSVTELYRDSCDHLERVIPMLNTNRVLVRMLVENSELIEKALGTGADERLLTAMFGGRLDEAYLAAARQYLEGGWYTRAQRVAERAREINADNPDTAHILEKLDLARADHRL